MTNERGSQALHDRTERDLAEEKAAALGRVLEKLAGTMAAARVAEQELRAASGPDRETCARHLEQARRRAGEHLWFAIVQREALGLRHHRELLEDFPIPPAFIGPAPR
ncbi:MAG: hypothetical protein ACREAA_12005 [Candidatus Polarisedimenticolia bacterium]